jgi:formyl-CoA transferase
LASVNRNKRSIVLDVKSQTGRDAIFKLVKTANAVVENAKTGVTDRAVIGYEQLRKQSRAQVHAAIRGFGHPRLPLLGEHTDEVLAGIGITIPKEKP